MRFAELRTRWNHTRKPDDSLRVTDHDRLLCLLRAESVHKAALELALRHNCIRSRMRLLESPLDC